MILSMSSPKAVSPAVDKLPIVRIRKGGFIKRWVTSIENEKDDAHRKQIDLFAHVGFVLVDLRSHVTHSSYQCPQLSCTLFTRRRLGEAHIDYFQVEVRIEHYIRCLKISMAKASLMHVHDSLQELLDVEADDRG